MARIPGRRVNAPPGHVPAPTRLEARQAEAPTTVQSLAAEARELAGGLGLALSANRLQRIVRRYAEQRPTGDFRTWFIAYADPTGETAVRNVMAGR